MNLDILEKKWSQEKKNLPKLTFTMFVYKYKESISTEEDLKLLCQYAGLKNYFSWKSNFIKTYPEIFKEIEDRRA